MEEILTNAHNAADIAAEVAEISRRRKEHAKNNMNDIQTHMAISLSNGNNVCCENLQIQFEHAKKQAIQTIKHAYATRVASLDAILKVQELYDEYSLQHRHQYKRKHPEFTY